MFSREVDERFWKILRPGPAARRAALPPVADNFGFGPRVERALIFGANNTPHRCIGFRADGMRMARVMTSRRGLRDLARAVITSPVTAATYCPCEESSVMRYS